MKNRILSLDLAPGQAALFYLGQVGFLLKYAGRYILIDGYLTDYVDRNCCTEAVTWVRLYAPPLKPEELDFVDFVFCTHAHFDHMDPWTLAAIAKVNNKARFYGPRSVTSLLPEYGIPASAITEVRTDQAMNLGDGISFTAIPSAHEELHPDGENSYLEVGYILTLGNLRIYHSGDCCLYDGLEERIMHMDALLLPINGRDYYRTVRKDIIGCFDSVEAITLAKNTGAGLLIPMHYDLYDVNAVNPAYFIDCLKAQSPAQSFHLFTPGEGYILSKGTIRPD